MAAICQVLCLHDECSNALEFKENLQKMGDRLFLNHQIDLVYVNAPLISGFSDLTIEHHRGQREWWVKQPQDQDASKNSEENSPGILCSNGGLADEEEFSWDEPISFESIPKVPSNHVAAPNNNQHHPVGLDASLLFLKQVWRSASYIGIIGIGQGASMGALLTLALQQQIMKPYKADEVAIPTAEFPPQFAIWINAYPSLFPQIKEPLFFSEEAQFLHLFSGGDLQRQESAELLHLQLGGEWYHSPASVLPSNNPRSYRTNGRAEDQNHWIPTNHEMNHMGKFLVEQKRRLFPSFSHNGCSDNSSAALVAIQQALYQTQEEASALLAKEIAANPPKALMAVIQPSRVTGRTPDQLERPPGGGAPCPPEFLLQRSKRESSNVEAGPSREHPSQAKEKAASE